MFDQVAAKPNRIRVCIIGGGGTGAAVAYDLSLRGFSVMLLERGELTSGTTGRHHGQLHSGARYAVGDRAIARECMEEALVLRRIVPDAIEYNGGVFVAIDDEEADRAPSFIAACLESGIPAREVPVAEARSWEPAINPVARRTVWVPDGSFDAFRLPLSFFAAARDLGATIRPFTEAVGLEVSGGRARAVVAWAAGDSSEERIECDYVVSASGAWAGAVGALAGLDVPITPAPGTLVAVRSRVSDMVLSRLSLPGDGDIIVPQRGLSIIGTTQRVALDPDCLIPHDDDTAFLLARADELAPGFSSNAIHAVWSAARPLSGRAIDDGRNLSRDFMVLDHSADGVAGMATLTGGKATVLRAMAEKAADRVCSEFGIDEPCRTRNFVLPSWRDWYAEAGL
ncbi:MAG: FAD-dependent oxidoreductase [Spirochaetae bacterium HGW-Spirochaetae-7]|jgi:glycerol-3-phosphate dehydrogenase|nr:MAG: FAD-dependent oxidoreductase [Spirochaetae bacterium HGW-Spirochaetae-7]